MSNMVNSEKKKKAMINLKEKGKNKKIIINRFLFIKIVCLAFKAAKFAADLMIFVFLSQMKVMPSKTTRNFET